MPFKYTMRISRLTVDKLGVKLYDKVSAVLAELIANAYDADAEQVAIHAPMGKYLASKKNGQLEDKGFEIKIEDDGAGMAPPEMQEFFLVVGAERREDARRGPLSRRFGRAVMGRKGVGKLAPFGICKVMEVLSAGGEKTAAENGEAGYRTSHIILNYDDIVAVGDEPDARYEPEVGDKDGTLSRNTGTTIALREFDSRKVSNIDVLARQVAQRFGIRSSDWQGLQRLRQEFAEHYYREKGERIELTNFERPNKRPDFVLSSQDGIAQIIEIKRPKHKLTNAEMERIVAYHDCMESFLQENAELKKRIQDFHITLVCDDVAVSGSQNAALRYMTKLTRLTWRDFLLRTETVHKDFLAEASRQKRLAISESDS